MPAGRQHAGARPCERRGGGKGIPGTAPRGPPASPWGWWHERHASSHQDPSPLPIISTPARWRCQHPQPRPWRGGSSPRQSAARWQAGGGDTHDTTMGEKEDVPSLSSSLFLLFFFFFIKALQNKVHTLPLQTHHHLSVRLSAAAGAAAPPLRAAASEQMVPGEGQAAAMPGPRRHHRRVTAAPSPLTSPPPTSHPPSSPARQLPAAPSKQPAPGHCAGHQQRAADGGTSRPLPPPALRRPLGQKSNKSKGQDGDGPAGGDGAGDGDSLHHQHLGAPPGCIPPAALHPPPWIGEAMQGMGGLPPPCWRGSVLAAREQGGNGCFCPPHPPVTAH